jgi:uncharacterized protein (DUF1501 family)
MLSRRQFLLISGGVAAGGAAGAAAWFEWAGNGGSRPAATAPTTTTAAAPASSPAGSAPAAAPSGRVLVVVQLGGGNDGLNTLVPVDGRYHDARPTLALGEGLVAVPGTQAYGLHPALAPLAPLLAAGHVAAVQALGYPHPDRSHFAALDAWWSGTPGRASTTGWLGRFLDATTAGGDGPMRAVSLGGGTPALAAGHVRPTVVFSPDAFALHPPAGADGAALLDAWAASATGAPDARAAVGVFQHLSAAAAPAADPGNEGEVAGDITASLDVAARLITSGDGAQVIYVNTSGFDTHANQAKTHERLLGDLATGITRFEQSLAAAHVDDRVLLMTVSEFGRRVAENGSGGTDHGKAGVQFLVGPMVRGGVYGEPDLGALDDGDVVATIDPRSLYTAALDWLGGPADEVLGGSFDPLGVVT